MSIDPYDPLGGSDMFKPSPWPWLIPNSSYIRIMLCSMVRTGVFLAFCWLCSTNHCPDFCHLESEFVPITFGTSGCAQWLSQRAWVSCPPMEWWVLSSCQKTSRCLSGEGLHVSCSLAPTCTGFCAAKWCQNGCWRAHVNSYVGTYYVYVFICMYMCVYMYVQWICMIVQIECIICVYTYIYVYIGICLLAPPCAHTFRFQYATYVVWLSWPLTSHGPGSWAEISDDLMGHRGIDLFHFVCHASYSLSIHPSIHLSICLFVYLFVYLSICLSAYRDVCIYIYTYWCWHWYCHYYVSRILPDIYTQTFLETTGSHAKPAPGTPPRAQPLAPRDGMGRTSTGAVLQGQQRKRRSCCMKVTRQSPRKWE